MLPDAETISSTLKGQLSVSTKISKIAQTATALPALKSSSLILLGKLCDDNCTVILDKKRLLAIKEDEIILRGRRNYLDGLWNIPIQLPYRKITTNNQSVMASCTVDNMKRTILLLLKNLEVLLLLRYLHT